VLREPGIHAVPGVLTYAPSFSVACKRRSTSKAPRLYTHRQISEPSLPRTAQYRVFPYRSMRMALYLPILTLPGWAGQGVTYPTLLPLFATTPLTVGAFVRVPHLTIALIPLQHCVVYSTEWAVLIGRLSHTLRRWLRRWLRWSLDAEPLARLLDLRLNTGEIDTAQGHHGFMAVQGGFQGDRHPRLRQRRCGSVRLRWCRLAA
jgi:hypothetical protein